MFSAPLDPGREVRGCSVSCALGMSYISPFRVAAALNDHMKFPELLILHFVAGVFWAWRDLVFLVFFL